MGGVRFNLALKTKPRCSHRLLTLLYLTTNKRAHLSACSDDAAVASILGRVSLKTSTLNSRTAESWKGARLKVFSESD